MATPPKTPFDSASAVLAGSAAAWQRGGSGQ
jgi:hypothetical protein